MRSGLSSGQAPFLYAISLLVVFLCLAALYESWSVPLAVILVIPLGLVGAIFAVTLRGLQNDVYLQIGLLTTMGLAAKNAILMVEFAERAERQGKRVIEAALEAARIRLAADPDDQLRLHLRRASAGHFDRRRRQQPHRHRHLGHRRHADRDHSRHLLHPAVLRAGPPRRSRRPDLSSRAAGEAQRGGGMRRFAPLAALLLAGCMTMEPDYARPDAAVPASWPAGDAYLRQSEAALPAVTYRDIFRDPRLQGLIAQGLANNRDLHGRRGQHRRRPRAISHPARRPVPRRRCRRDRDRHRSDRGRRERR